MTILVVSLDYDGCFAHDNIIDGNIKILNRIKTESQHYGKTIVMVGSNRQSVSIDKHNSKLNSNRSCFSEIKKICEFLGVELEPLLLSDLYNNLSDGTSFDRALAIDSELQHHAEYLFDSTKVTLLCAQMHAIANKYLGEEIIFDFYDDSLDILYGLFKFNLATNNHYVPHNVTLRLHRYMTGSEDSELEMEIRGKGRIVQDYRQMVHDLSLKLLIANGQQISSFSLEQVFPSDKKNLPRLLEIASSGVLSVDDATVTSENPDLDTLHAISFAYDYRSNSSATELMQTNETVLQKIKDKYAGCREKYIFIGSNSQSFNPKYAIGKGPNACFVEIEEISAFLGTTLVPSMLADIYGNLEDGTSYRRAKHAIATDAEQEHAASFDDNTKITLLCLQMHKIARENLDRTIIFSFYSNQSNLLKILLAFHQKTSGNFVPRNVILQLHEYNRTETNLTSELIGQGKVCDVKDVAKMIKSLTINILMRHCVTIKNEYICKDLDQFLRISNHHLLKFHSSGLISCESTLFNPITRVRDYGDCLPEKSTQTLKAECMSYIKSDRDENPSQYKRLAFYPNCVNDHDIPVLLQILEACPEITELDLSHQLLTDEGAKELAKTTVTLTWVSILWNRTITKQGRKDLRDSPNIQSLESAMSDAGELPAVELEALGFVPR
jgi:hypothetical protein